VSIKDCVMERKTLVVLRRMEAAEWNGEPVNPAYDA
jgi:hypothetical protein